MLGGNGKVLRRPRSPADFYALTGKTFDGGGALWGFDEASGNLMDLSAPVGFTYKTAATGWGTGVASSVETAAGDCYVHYTIPWDGQIAPAYSTMIGLCDHDVAPTLANTDFAIYWYNSTTWLRFWESGAEIDVGATAAPGDKIGVRRTGTTIEYLKNDVVVYTSLTANANPLRCSVNNYTSATYSTIVFEDDGVVVPFTWQHVAGMNVARDLIVAGAPTFNAVLNGHRGVAYPAVSAKHTAYVARIAPTESCIFGAIVTMADCVNQSHVWGGFTGVSYAMLYWSAAEMLTWRIVSGATVAVALGNPTKDARQYFVGGQIDRAAVKSRGLYARQGQITKNEASAAGVGGLYDIFGPNSYASGETKIRIELGFVLRGPQCEGATELDNLAYRLGAA